MMMKRHHIFRLIVIIPVVLIAISTVISSLRAEGEIGGGPEITATVSEYQTETELLTVLTANGKMHEFHVELARTPPEWKYGLMYRQEMAEDHGMLFVFPAESLKSFWMKNTFIPLDMIFIRRDGEIANIAKNAKPHDLATHPSDGLVLAVLEVNGGITDKLGIKAGDFVYHKAFDNIPED